MLKYLYSIFFVVCFATMTAQKKDSVSSTQTYGLRVGVDIHRLSKSFYDNNYRGLELVGDYRLTDKMYAALELGTEKKTVADDRLDFTTNGSYLKIGFDYNTFKNWLDMENMIYVGMRLGFSSFNQTLDTYKIYDPTNYYGLNTVTSGEKFDGLTASWIEVVGGLKAEIFSNVYVGFSIRLNYLVTQKQPDNFDNLFIPGFNRTYDGKFGAGFNYTVSYLLPIFKKEKK